MPTTPRAMRTTPSVRCLTSSSPAGQDAPPLLVLLRVDLATREPLVQDVERPAVRSGRRLSAVREGPHDEHDAYHDECEEQERHEHHAEPPPPAVPRSVHHECSPPRLFDCIEATFDRGGSFGPDRSVLMAAFDLGHRRSSGIPHFEHRPGCSLVTSGCTGHSASAECSSGGRRIIRSISGPPVRKNRTTRNAESTRNAMLRDVV